MTLFRPRLARAVLLAGWLMSPPAVAQERVALRGDVVATRDTLTLGDLVQGAPERLAGTALFRSPTLGQTGTIQAHRIVDAATHLGLGLETGGRLQIAVTRAARQVGPAEIETALKRALEAQVGLDGRWTGIAFDGAPPALVVAPDLVGDLKASDVVYDRRTRRWSATVWLGPSETEKRASLQVAGSTVEVVEVAILSRNLDRGEVVKAADVAVERRLRDAVGADAAFDGMPLAGRVARRALVSGALVRAGDLMRPEIVSRGDTVTMVYEVPGIVLSLRARATEGGGLGDTIAVVNPGSKKTVQAKVIGPGKVSVTPGDSQRVVASAAAPSPQ